jgi:hypothetical protein
MHDAAVVTDCVEISSGFSVFFWSRICRCRFRGCVQVFGSLSDGPISHGLSKVLFHLRFHEERVSSRCFGIWLQWSVELLRWHSQTGEF